MRALSTESGRKWPFTNFFLTRSVSWVYAKSVRGLLLWGVAMTDRLDAQLWQPTALGTVGPTGLIGQALSSPGGFLYRPLRASEVQGLSLPEGVRETIVMTRGLHAIRRLDFDGATRPALTTAAPAVPDRSWLAFTAADEAHGLYGRLITRPVARDESVADLYYARFNFSFLRPRHIQVVKGLWQFFLNELGQAGFVAITSFTSNGEVERHALELGGFATFSEVSDHYSLRKYQVSESSIELS